jgi:hypothetical protein
MSSNSVTKRKEHAIAETDAMAPELRQCVHEYGLPIVSACVKYGVRKPAHIHELVKEIWDGARQLGQRGNGVENRLDWLLMQAGAVISAATLIRFLHSHSMVILPNHPTDQMIDASLETVANHDVRVTKRQKHTLRLRAAIDAYVAHQWKFLRDSVRSKSETA